MYRQGQLESIFNQGIQFHRLGAFAEAKRCYKAVLNNAPKHFDAMHYLALAESQLGRHDKADRLIRDALKINPKSADAHANRGNIQRELGRLNDALASYEKALALNPDLEGAILNRGSTLLALGRPAEALACFERLLTTGTKTAGALNNYGQALLQLGRFEDARESFERLLAIDPQSSASWCNLGNTFLRLRRLEDALASFDKALEIDPGHPDVLNNRGNALIELGRVEDAIASFDAALAANAKFADALANRANAKMRLGRHESAIEDYERLLAVSPNFPYALGSLIDANLQVCNWNSLGPLRKRVRSELRAGNRVVRPFQFQAFNDSSRDQLRATQIWVNDLVRLSAPSWQGPRYRHERVRLGYLSSDFREHAVGRLIVELLECHDRSRFETIAISFGADDGSELRARFQRGADQFIDVREKTDEEIAALVRSLEIDIAIDLNGYTENARINVLGRRPAPVQVSYVGFIGTMAVDFIDYMIADRHVIPAELACDYTEHIVTMPDCYWVNDTKRTVPEATPTRAQCGLPETGFVFCCFNNNHKISPEIFAIWMRMLQQIDGSVLWLFEGNQSAVRNLRRTAQSHGVSAERLVFAPRMAPSDHLARHRLADLFVDTLPYNAHTTTVDALWAGLPVVTCMGKMFQGRVAASMLHAIDMPELVTHSLEAYEALALDLARNPAALALIKDKLVANRLTTPLFDTKRFARNIEAAYATMYERHQRGEQPQAFSVKDQVR